MIGENMEPVISDNRIDQNRPKTPEEKVDSLKKAIEGLGYKLEETSEGDIKILE